MERKCHICGSIAFDLPLHKSWHAVLAKELGTAIVGTTTIKIARGLVPKRARSIREGKKD